MYIHTIKRPAELTPAPYSKFLSDALQLDAELPNRVQVIRGSQEAPQQWLGPERKTQECRSNAEVKKLPKKERAKENPKS